MKTAWRNIIIAFLVALVGSGNLELTLIYTNANIKNICTYLSFLQHQYTVYSISSKLHNWHSQTKHTENLIKFGSSKIYTFFYLYWYSRILNFVACSCCIYLWKSKCEIIYIRVLLLRNHPSSNIYSIFISDFLLLFFMFDPFSYHNLSLK